MHWVRPKLPSVDSHDCSKAKQALLQPAPGRQVAAALAGCSNAFGHVCGSVGGVLRVAGMGGGREARGRHNLAALWSMLPQAIKM